jgi:two-component system response regulator MprA
MAAKKVLIIDDDSLLSRTIDMCLSKKGHRVNVFYSGVDAVKYLFEERPDSVVLDIRLPDCDGWFIARLLERLEGLEKVPVIVISVLEPDRRELADVKPYAYIQKPFDMGQLLQTVEKSLGEERPRVHA